MGKADGYNTKFGNKKQKILFKNILTLEMYGNQR